MNLISVENISKGFGDKVLFENITFGINEWQKVALVAKNGAGKSTLLKIITGKDIPDSGNVSTRNDLKIALLEQDSIFDPKTPIAKAVTNNHAISKALLDNDYSQLNDDESALVGNIKTVCGKLKIDDYHKLCGTCSGGQLKRISLAKVLIAEADLLILDEPTNHLDIDMIEWLENFLTNSAKTLLLVTHDRYFLDRICDEILELEDKTLYKHRGNYQYYLQRRSERIESQLSTIDKAKNLYRKELDWMRRMPKARSTKAKYRQDAFYETESVAKKRIEDKQVNLEINISRIGSKILEIHKISKSVAGRLLINGFDYTFKKGEKIGIVGPNGVGKSTLLNLIMGKIEPDAGKIVPGETMVFGYFEQQGIQFSDNKRVIEVIKEVGEFIPLAGGKKITASQLLERFLFAPETHYQMVGKLSGGEKRRLYLITILMKNPNFLVLDEPTNDLDIHTLTALEDYIDNFEGCVLLVTHDRFFMDRIVDHVFVFEEGGHIKDILGNYTKYREQKKELEKLAKSGTDGEKKISEKEMIKTNSLTGAEEKKKISFKEKFELEQLDKEIPKLENRKKELEEKLANVGSNHEELVKISAELGKISEELDAKGLRWLELTELM
ncbi:MAG TPA: ABC-F family ATP-binding cassette domain-containing protein [Flavobacteriales bacterium]|nr:ABC-F family ATP-binding cassette domain-containing protein [Flavobacteriales bacterium]